jgi:hypothetical protein
MSKDDYDLDWEDFVVETTAGSPMKATHITSLHTNIDLIKDNLANTTHNTGVLDNQFTTHNDGDRVGHNSVLKTTNWNDRDITEHSNHKTNYYSGHMTSRYAAQCSTHHLTRYNTDNGSKETSHQSTHESSDEAAKFDSRDDNKIVVGCDSYHTVWFGSHKSTVRSSQYDGFLGGYEE